MIKIFSFLGFLGIVGFIITFPIFMVRLKTAMKIALAIFSGLLLWWRFTGPSDREGVLFVVVFASIAIGMSVSLRLLCVLFLHFADKKRCFEDVETASPYWLDLVVGFGASGILTLIFFCNLAWATSDLSHAMLLHVSLALFCIWLFAKTTESWLKRPASRLFLHPFGIGTATVLLALTAYSWFWYPTLVRSEAYAAVNGSDHCIYFPTTQKIAQVGDRLTLLTLAKRRRGGNFFLVSREKAWAWSYYERGFVPDQKANRGWLQRVCFDQDQRE